MQINRKLVSLFKKRVANGTNSHLFEELAPLPKDFDPEIYLKLNSDVRGAALSPEEHWQKFGAKENRAYKIEAAFEEFVVPENWTTDHAFGAGVDVLNFCFAHTKPLVPIHDDVVIFEMGQKGSTGGFGLSINCEELLPQYREYKQYLGGFYGIFAARKYLSENNSTNCKAVNFMTYRLFTLPFRTPNRNLDLNMNLIRPDATDLIKHLVAPAKAASEWFLPHPHVVDSVEEQYLRNHKIGDLDLFLACATKIGILTPEEQYACRSNPFYIPAFACGRLPTSAFLQIAEKVEVVVEHFLKVAEFDGRDNYQIKFVQFCCERLFNYLVEIEFRKTHGILDLRHLGFWTLITETGSYVPGIVKTEFSNARERQQR